MAFKQLEILDRSLTLFLEDTNEALGFISVLYVEYLLGDVFTSAPHSSHGQEYVVFQKVLRQCLHGKMQHSCFNRQID